MTPQRILECLLMQLNEHGEYTLAVEKRWNKDFNGISNKYKIYRWLRSNGDGKKQRIEQVFNKTTDAIEYMQEELAKWENLEK